MSGVTHIDTDRQACWRGQLHTGLQHCFAPVIHRARLVQQHEHTAGLRVSSCATEPNSDRVGPHKDSLRSRAAAKAISGGAVPDRANAGCCWSVCT